MQLNIVSNVSKNAFILEEPTQTISFPLSQPIRDFIDSFELFFNTMDNAMGLAAPQVGHAYPIIIYHLPETAKAIRTDITEVKPPQLLINPQYKAIAKKKNVNWEGCFSVTDVMGEVERYSQIEVTAYQKDGTKFSFIAEGLEARVLQHEIDHINGLLFTRLLTTDHRSGPIEKMQEIRKKEKQMLG